jgi:Recombination protein U
MMTSKRVIGGKRAVSNGKLLEEIVATANEGYRRTGRAVINRIHTGTRITKDGKGIYANKVMADYWGVLPGGRAVIIECKYRDNILWTPGGNPKDIYMSTLLLAHQVEACKAVQALGGMAVVIVGTRNPAGCFCLFAMYYRDEVVSHAAAMLCDVRRSGLVYDWLVNFEKEKP